VDDFQAIAIILALATVFFGTQYDSILEARAVDKPPAGYDAIDRYHRRLNLTIYFKAAPLAAITCLSSYLLFPEALWILKADRFSILDFDFISTAWIFVEALLLAAFAWSLTQLYFLLAKRLKD
jgi:hypothetical protein